MSDLSPPVVHELVVVSLESWDLVWRRNQYLVTELLRADPALVVLFVEPAADPLHEARRGFRPRAGHGLRRADPVEGVGPDQLWLYQPTKILPRRVDPRVDARLASLVRRAARRVGLTRPVLWVNDPAAATLVEDTGWPSLYDVTDDWVAADRPPEIRRRLLADEALLLRACEEVTVCSPHLAASKGAERAVTLVTNGVDVDRYRLPRDRPADLPVGPVALYLGTVHRDRFDLDLVARTAATTAGTGTVVVVGPVLDLTSQEYDDLTAAGVRLLGARPWTEVPAYLQHATALLVPHLVDDFTDSLDPLKLYEYRAVGRPVVATPVAGFRDARDPRVTVAAPADYPQAVRVALTAPAATDTHQDDDIPTWDVQGRAMRDVIERARRRGATPR
ncbi:glycosyltransferase [Oerskovia jenensis]|uniref:Glycosyltransferase involved in cell wall biosynthesis n=1 Tax=Oerskovia jenensis TaxID=162169 RepID=A0ABS2LJZ8_9CELL|nr:glycosyltransferase [Oerskovia jenensis]MBM7480209.1 glycosyltransferase involved in cell wall biosynthesis [Oerskovia jenensis]